MVRVVDERAVLETEAVRAAGRDQRGALHVERLEDARPHLVLPRRARDSLDELAEDDEVRVGVVEPGTWLADSPGGFGDADQLGRRPDSMRVLLHDRLVEVLVQPARVLQAADAG